MTYYRIVQRGDSYFVQFKFLFFWCTTQVAYSSIKEAERGLEESKKATERWYGKIKVIK